MEAESELTVTQLKEKRQAELAVREIEELECQRQEEERAKREEDQGIDWGLGEFRYRPQLSDVFSQLNGRDMNYTKLVKWRRSRGGVLYWGTRKMGVFE
jgi:hypothetical protein